jgi:hypothetical protein
LWTRAPLPFSPCGRRWIDAAKAAARRMRGLSPHEGSVAAERTPHPALRATFSHKGRREEKRRMLTRHHKPTLFNPHGEEARSAVSNHAAPLVPFILRDARDARSSG